MLANLAQMIVAGLSNGAIYALVALGFCLVYSVNRYLNLLQGEFVVVGGLLTIWFTDVHGWNLIVAALAAVAISCVVGVLFQRLTLSPSRRLAPDVALMVTFGGAYVFRGVAMLLFGKDPLSLPSFSGEAPLFVGEVAISTQSIWIVAALLLASAVLWWFFNRTFTGKAMLACAENPNGAQLVGIDLRSLSTQAYAVAAAIGAIAGIVAGPLTFVTYDGGVSMALKGFIAAVFGGIGSYPGAVLGGILLGLLEAMATGYISSEFKDALAFGALLVMLLVRPHGILGAHK
jgi:branched-chain amino acid transport system permease protein